MIRLMMYCTKGVVRAGVGTDGQSLYGDTHTAVYIITPQTTIVDVNYRDCNCTYSYM